MECHTVRERHGGDHCIGFDLKKMISIIQSGFLRNPTVEIGKGFRYGAPNFDDSVKNTHQREEKPKMKRNDTPTMRSKTTLLIVGGNNVQDLSHGGPFEPFAAAAATFDCGAILPRIWDQGNGLAI